MKEYKLVLASASPRRKEILEQIGLEFEICVSDASEIITESEPDEIVKQISGEKAKAVALKYPKGTVVIGADTVVVKDKAILGKPSDKDKAFEMIKELKNGCHSVYTGVTIIHEDKSISFACETKVYVYDMSDDEIREYVDCGECMDKAGAYGIQGRFARYIEKIDGDYYNVVGLPVSRLMQELKKLR